jgi:hypothetical protein
MRPGEDSAEDVEYLAGRKKTQELKEIDYEKSS